MVEKLLTEYLLNPSWWISTLIGGVFLVWISEYLRKKVGQLFAIFSEKWESRNEQKRIAREEAIRALSFSGHELMRQEILVNRYFLRGLATLLLGTGDAILFLSAGIFRSGWPEFVTNQIFDHGCVAFFMIMQVLAVRSFSKGAFKMKVIREARKLFFERKRTPFDEPV